MAIKIGSAHIDQRGKTRGGKAGDQTGGEVSVQNWYKAKLGWIMLRPNSRAAGLKIARAMEAACNNNHIGYDQSERNSLYEVAQKYGFDTSKVTENCETDCSALVRVCLAYAGIMTKSFNTKTEPDVLPATGQITKFTDSKYTTQSDYLRAGDILCTKTQGHTVIVLNDGARADLSDIGGGQAPSEPIPPDNPGEGDYVTTTGSYWLRTKPSILGNRIIAIPSGTRVRVYGRASTGWYGIKTDDGYKGYISPKAFN